MKKDFIEKDIRTIPGKEYLFRTLKELETVSEKIFPESFPLSLWMIGFSLRDHVRQELIIPENPKDEASYWLGFDPENSYFLRDSILVRITDRPQSFLGILDHLNIGEIMTELRSAYDGKVTQRHHVIINIPSRDWSLEESFTSKPRGIGFDIISPTNVKDIAADFENVLRKYSAIETLLKVGYEKLYDDVEKRIIDIQNLS